jgi:PAS domain S-box-containing protein
MESMVSRYRLWFAHAAALFLVLAGGSVLAVRPEQSQIAEILFSAAVGLVTYCGGLKQGVVWMIAPLLRIAFVHDLDAVGAIVENLLIWGLTGSALVTRKRLEYRTRTLHETEEQYRSVVEQATEIIFVVDTAGHFTSLNPAFETIVGWPRERWLGRHFLELVAPEDRASIAQAFLLAAANDRHSLKRIVVCRPDDTRVVLEVALAHRYSDSRHVGFLGISRDVTARERVEEELRRSRQQLEDAQRIARLGSWTVNLQTGHCSWSDEHYRILGLEPQSVPASFELLRAALDEPSQAALDSASRVLRTAQGHAWEADLTVEGVRKHLSFRGLVERVDGVARIYGTVQDLSDRKRAEEQLRESEERFHLIARATNDAVWDWNIADDQLWWGDNYNSMFGFAADVAPSFDTWVERIHADDRQRVLTSIRQAAAGSEHSWSAEYRYRYAQGGYAQVLDRGFIVRDSASAPVRMTGAILDLTEMKRLQEQLAQATRVSSLGRVAASMAHEFNNVLMGIQPNVEIIRRYIGEQLQLPVEHIVRSVARGKRITEEILRFTRRATPELQCVGVNDFFAHWAQETRPVLGSTELRFAIGDSAQFVRVDPLQMAQVFTNLAVNARDAIGEAGGTLTIHAELAENTHRLPFPLVPGANRLVHLRVEDTGCGMLPEQLEHAFEPLFTTKKGGTGLGLAISYQLVTQHDGQMFVESEPGRGTTFHIFLPAAVAPAGTGELTPEPAPGAKRIVLVEDDPAVAFGLRALLELDGHGVTVAHSGREGLEVIERMQPNCIILDIGLPDMDGLELFRRVHARWPGLPTLFSSGHADAARLSEYLQLSFVGLLLKPYPSDQLRSMLAEITAPAPRSLAVC